MGVRFPLPEPRHAAWHASADRVIDQLLRGRLTVGRDALNVLVLVRFQPPQLATEVIRPDQEPVLKTGGRHRDLWVRVPRLPLIDSNTRVPGVIGSTAGSNPVGQGSSPWGRASLGSGQLRTANHCR